MFAKDTFKNKYILVTGGRSGIGFQIAKDFLCLGATVIIASRKEEPLAEAAEKLRRQWLGKGGRVCKIAIKGQNREAIGKNS